MKPEIVEMVIKVTAVIIVVVVVLVIGGWAAALKCSDQWEGSGMSYSWGPIKKCVIQLNDGTWVSANSYRVRTK